MKGVENRFKFFAKEALNVSNVKESQYQSRIIKKLEELFPGCTVLKTDANYRQGFPDLLILWHQYWATLEVKTERAYLAEPNQDYYIEKLNGESFAAYIYPECEGEVLGALQQAFKSPRRTRVSKS
jgi:hypothetical protein